MIYEETMAHPETGRLINRFTRRLPRKDKYKNRLHQELVLKKINVSCIYLHKILT